MTDLDSFVSAIDAAPADDALWLVFADWLEERGSPAAGLVRRAIGRQNWYEAVGTVARILGHRELQILACDLVEPLLPVLDRTYPDRTTPRRLVDAVRNDPTDRNIPSLQNRVDHLIATAMNDMALAREHAWLASTVARCLEDFAAKPRQSCISSARATAFRKAEVAPPRDVRPHLLFAVGFVMAEGHRDVIEVELRRLAARAIERHLRPKAAGSAGS